MRTAVITGGAAGLGADVARRLSEAGYRIGIFDLGADRVAQTASEIDNAVGIEADVLLSSFARLRGVGEFSSPRGLTRKEHKSSTIFSLWCNNSAIDLQSGRNCLVKLWNS